MATTVKKVNRGVKLTLWEKMYIPEIIRGMYITLRHFFINLFGNVMEIFGGRGDRKIQTLYYPEELPNVPIAYRGRPVLVADAKGVEKCVACGLCEVACPPNCISIIGAERGDGERYPISYTLDGSRCIFCGLCEEACPKEAIVMSGEWQNICEYDRSKMIYKKKDLLRSEKSLKKRINILREKYFNKGRY